MIAKLDLEPQTLSEPQIHAEAEVCGVGRVAPKEQGIPAGKVGVDAALRSEMIVDVTGDQANRSSQIAARAESAKLGAQSKTSRQQKFATTPELKRGVRLTRHAHPAWSGKQVSVRILRHRGRQTKNQHKQAHKQRARPEKFHCYRLYSSARPLAVRFIIRQAFVLLRKRLCLE